MILRHRTDKYLVILITALRGKKKGEREREKGKERERDGRKEGEAIYFIDTIIDLCPLLEVEK